MAADKPFGPRIDGMNANSRKLQNRRTFHTRLLQRARVVFSIEEAQNGNGLVALPVIPLPVLTGQLSS